MCKGISYIAIGMAILIEICSCGNYDSPSVTSALVLISEIRVAEERYHVRFGRFGSFEELELEADEPTRAQLKRCLTRLDTYYLFDLQVNRDHYQIRASPVNWRRPLKPSFYADESGLVQHDPSPELANSQSAH